MKYELKIIRDIKKSRLSDQDKMRAVSGIGREVYNKKMQHTTMLRGLTDLEIDQEYSIETLFSWNRTPEGIDFWAKVTQVVYGGEE